MFMYAFVLPQSHSIWKRSKISGDDIKYYTAANRSSLKLGEGKEAIYYIAYSLAFHIIQYSLQCGVLKIRRLPVFKRLQLQKSHYENQKSTPV